MFRFVSARATYTDNRPSLSPLTLLKEKCTHVSIRYGMYDYFERYIGESVSSCSQEFNLKHVLLTKRVAPARPGVREVADGIFLYTTRVQGANNAAAVAAAAAGGPTFVYEVGATGYATIY